jgi:hypothetical protein
LLNFIQTQISTKIQNYFRRHKFEEEEFLTKG